MRRVEIWLVRLLIIFLPFSWRWVVWGPGKFNEWQSVFFYGSDLLIGCLIIVGFWHLTVAKSWSLVFRRPHVYLILFLVWSVISAWFSPSKMIGFFKVFKLLEFAGLYFYFALAIKDRLHLSSFLGWLLASGFFQAILAIAQAIRQSSLGLQFLGESVLRTNFNGVAVVPLASGEKFLRAYGLLLHPNILAWWLALAILAFGFWYFKLDHSRRWLILVYPVLLWGLFFTFSRTVVGIFGLGVAIGLIWLWSKRFSLGDKFIKRLKPLIWVSIVTSLVFVLVFWPVVSARFHVSLEEEAITERLTYNQLGTSTILQNLLLGVGPGQFANHLRSEFPNYPDYFYQPVHNVYLLIASETGLLGLLAFLFWLGYLIYQSLWFKSRPNSDRFFVRILVFSVLVLGLFDHFLWSIHLGQMSWAIWLGIIGSRIEYS